MHFAYLLSLKKKPYVHVKETKLTESIMAFVSDFQTAPLVSFGQTLTTAVKKAVKTFGTAMVFSMEASSRVAKIEELNRKSDEELAEIGVRREDIARLVYNDILYV